MLLFAVTIRERMKSEDLRNQWNAEEMINDIQNYQLQWNQHVLTNTRESVTIKIIALPTRREERFRKTLSQMEGPIYVVAEGFIQKG